MASQAVDESECSSLARHPHRTLSDLLSERENVDWSAISLRLATHPHEAAPHLNHRNGGGGIAHTPPLTVALRRSSPPPPASVVSALLSAHPPSVRHVDPYGYTPLFDASLSCGLRGLDPLAARAVLDAHPRAASQPARNGSLPLHLACDLDVARMLLRAHPRAVLHRNEAGNLPLHRAAAWHSEKAPELVRMLLDAEEGLDRDRQGSAAAALVTTTGDGVPVPGVLVRNRNGQTPVDIVFERVKMWDCGRMDELGRPVPLKKGEGGSWEWDKLKVLVRGAWHVFRRIRGDAKIISRRSEDDFSTLHAVLEMGAPPEVVWHALTMEPNHVRTRDVYGRLPLHIAAERYNRGNSDGFATGRSYVHSLAVAKLLLESEFGCSRAAHVVDPTSGKLPLHIAASCGMEIGRGLNVILAANPDALVVLDKGGERLPPFVHAALGLENASEGDCIDTVYGLLREAPHLLACYAKR